MIYRVSIILIPFPIIFVLFSYLYWVTIMDVNDIFVALGGIRGVHRVSKQVCAVKKKKKVKKIG